MERRSAVAAAFAALVLCSGCLGVLTGSEPASFESSPAAVSGDALAETGYERAGNETRAVERTFTVLGQNRTAEVTSHVATYERRAAVGPFGERTVGWFAVVSTPAVELAGETYNPVAGDGGAELIRRFGGAYGRIENASAVGSRNVTALGTETTVRKYAAEAVVDGRRVPVSLRVTTVRDGDDFVVAVGVSPRSVGGEAATLRLVRSLRHPA